MTSRVPHAAFMAVFAADSEFPHPPGASFARSLQAHLRSHFTSVADFDNWRDVGWSVEIRLGEKAFEVYFAPFGPEGRWLLAVAPLGQPGAIARFFGKKAEPSEAELKSLSKEIHALLSSTSGIADIQWMFGGPPGKVPGVNDPAQLGWQIAL